MPERRSYQRSGDDVLLDRALFPYCPSCGKVVRICTRPAGVGRVCDECGSPRVFPGGPGRVIAWWVTFTIGPLVWLVWLALWLVLSPLAILLATLTDLPVMPLVRQQRSALWYWFWVFLTLGALTNPERAAEAPGGGEGPADKPS